MPPSRRRPCRSPRASRAPSRRNSRSATEAVVEASLEILDARGFRKGFASARVSRSRTVREDATLNQREAAWFAMTEALLNDFDKELEKNIRQYLLGFLL